VRLKTMAGHRGLKVGSCIMEFATPGIGHVLKGAGCDFAFVDMEHSGFTFDLLKQVLRYLEAADLPVVVRPPSKNYTDIAMAKDMGAEGLLLPHLRNEEEAQSILASMLYPPDGVRGVALQIAHDRYEPGPSMDKLAAANREAAFFCTIENRDGLENVEAIASVPGVDGLWLGHNDLSASLGVPGAYDHPDFVAAEERVAKAAATHGKSYGRVANSPSEAERLFAAGADTIICSGDIWLLFEALRGMTSEIRERLAGREAGSTEPG
jgi:2-keto-3-deoxy-L-rhamnonate aldolase RhmA